MFGAERAESARAGAGAAQIARWLTTCGLIAGTTLALAACGSSASNSGNANKAAAGLGTVLYGSLPPVGTPKPGGTIAQGQLTGQTPVYIFPLVPGAQSTTGTIELVTSLFMPLYGGPTGARPQVSYGLSAASGPPQPSNGDKTYTIPLKTNLHWSNGQPVVANDVIFDIDLLKAAVKESVANWGQYVPGQFPASVVSATAPNTHTVVLRLNKAYNPGYFLNNQLQDTDYGAYPMPSTAWNIASAGGPHLDYTNPANAKKIYDYLNKQGGSVASFGASPLWKIGDGPFKLTSFSATNSSFVLAANPSYGGSPKPQASQVDVNTYTSFTAELNALKSGSLGVMVGLDPSQLAQAPALKAQGIDVFGGPSWGWFAGQINFKDTTGHFDKIIAQPYVRQAIDEMINQPAIIAGVYKGAAVPAYGPTPSAPTSPYAPASATAPTYPYNPAAAVALLRSRGWKVVPNGQTTCAKAGTAAGDCGAGIPAGTPLSFTWANEPQQVSSVYALESEALASEAKQAAGINITLLTKPFNFLVANYNDANPGAVKYTNDWGVNNYGGLFMDYYPTQEGTWNTGAQFNTGAFSDPTADKLMTASVFGTNPADVKTEAQYFAKILPVFFFPDKDYLLAVNSTKVGGPSDGWTAMTQQEFFPQYWYPVKG
ncbi:MAG: ABC transporter substrate-binding protein [Actinomycetota bacterium]|nr:ABC transporter substrate-binding protein [Actinomycetota bacterium]